MVTSKQILVVTTSSIEGLKIKKYLKPISAHVVAGTNVFSDFAASFTDFFGGRSNTYQNQLTSLYNDAIEQVKMAAFEIGANCVLGLTVDLDEISGKGKAMFMITVVGTAVVIDNLASDNDSNTEEDSVSDSVSFEKIQTLHRKRRIIEDSTKESWLLDDGIWEFITQNKIDEVFPRLIKKYRFYIGDEKQAFYKRLITYINNLPEPKKVKLVYAELIAEKEESKIQELYKIISDLQLLDLKFIIDVLVNNEFADKKKALQVLALPKPFYNKDDVNDLLTIKQLIESEFTERAQRSTKKQLLSSKEKEIWTCECGEVNDLESGENKCYRCTRDLYGFKPEQINPRTAIAMIDNRIDLITHFLK